MSERDHINPRKGRLRARGGKTDPLGDTLSVSGFAGSASVRSSFMSWQTSIEGNRSRPGQNKSMALKYVSADH
jgi:hypothetical protein